MPKRTTGLFALHSREPPVCRSPPDPVSGLESSPYTRAGLWTLRDSPSCPSDVLVDLERVQEDDIFESSVAPTHPKDSADDTLADLVSYCSLEDDLSLVLRSPQPAALGVPTPSSSVLRRSGPLSICSQLLAAPGDVIPKLKLKAPTLTNKPGQLTALSLSLVYDVFVADPDAPGMEGSEAWQAVESGTMSVSAAGRDFVLGFAFEV